MEILKQREATASRYHCTTVLCQPAPRLLSVSASTLPSLRCHQVSEPATVVRAGLLRRLRVDRVPPPRQAPGTLNSGPGTFWILSRSPEPQSAGHKGEFLYFSMCVPPDDVLLTCTDDYARRLWRGVSMQWEISPGLRANGGEFSLFLGL